MECLPGCPLWVWYDIRWEASAHSRTSLRFERAGEWREFMPLNHDLATALVRHWLYGAREREKRGEKFDPNAPDARGGDGAEG